MSRDQKETENHWKPDETGARAANVKGTMTMSTLKTMAPKNIHKSLLRDCGCTMSRRRHTRSESASSGLPADTSKEDALLEVETGMVMSVFNSCHALYREKRKLPCTGVHATSDLGESPHSEELAVLNRAGSASLSSTTPAGASLAKREPAPKAVGNWSAFSSFSASSSARFLRLLACSRIGMGEDLQSLGAESFGTGAPLSDAFSLGASAQQRAPGSSTFNAPASEPMAPINTASMSAS
mmetsp:Transcript_78095/g.225836  ORF Transcript_78095/g.225836 Transcript_78095/m.225836 type:complete len:240 (-) Transcript_78095:180-899(-)